MKDKIIGYTTGVYDLFHVGHVNMIRNSKSLCDYLIVGVSTDELVSGSYKCKQPIIPFEDRVEVVRSCKYVDLVVPQEDMDKLKAWKKLKFDVMFVGDDWYGTEKWNTIEEELKKLGVKIVYFPYTKKISTTLINKMILEKRK